MGRKANHDPGGTGELRAELLSPLPERLAVGRGTALVLAGRCSHARKRIRQLEVAVAGDRAPAAVCTSRPWIGRERDTWWALVPIGPVDEERRATIELRVRLRGEEEARAAVGSLRLIPELPYSESIEESAEPAPDAGPLIAICMATWNPDIELFRRQVESIRNQTYPNWVCVISDDGSSDVSREAIHEVLAGDRRFTFHRFPNVGLYRNFERVLALSSPNAELIALCDQDDEWQPHKLESLKASFDRTTTQAYSDMRLVTPGGGLLSPTYWSLRETNHTDLRKLVLANTITGAASMLRRELLETALPFPPPVGELYHDHWIATAALSLGDVAYVDEPLYDYVQHRAAALGHAEANLGAVRPRRHLWRWLRAVPSVAAGRRIPAFYTRVYLPARLIATVLERRCAPDIEPAKLRTLRAFSHRGAWLPLSLAADALKPGLRRTATLGRERSFLAALGWQALARLRGSLGAGTRSRESDWR